MVLDGEIVAFDKNGRPSFQRLQRRMHVRGESAIRRLAKDVPVTYVIFDLLWLDGQCAVRPALLRTARTARGARPRRAGWHTPDHVAGDGAAMLEAASRRARGHRRQAARLTYEPGRRDAALDQGQEPPPRGGGRRRLAPGEGKREDRIGALLVGVEEDGGAPLRRARRHRVHRGRARAARRTSSSAARLAVRGERRAQAAARSGLGRAELVAEVEFAEWTSDGVMRHPSYKGLREEAPTSASSTRARRARRRRGDGRRPHAGAHQPRQGALSRGRLHASARSSSTSRASRPRCCRTCEDRRSRASATRTASTTGSSSRSSARATGPTGSRSRRSAVEEDHRLLVVNDLPTLVWLGKLAASSCTRRCRARRRSRPRRWSSTSTRAPGDDRRVLPGRAASCSGMFGTSG